MLCLLGLLLGGAGGARIWLSHQAARQEVRTWRVAAELALAEARAARQEITRHGDELGAFPYLPTDPPVLFAWQRAQRAAWRKFAAEVDRTWPFAAWQAKAEQAVTPEEWQDLERAILQRQPIEPLRRQFYEVAILNYCGADRVRLDLLQQSEPQVLARAVERWRAALAQLDRGATFGTAPELRETFARFRVMDSVSPGFRRWDALYQAHYGAEERADAAAAYAALQVAAAAFQAAREVPALNAARTAVREATERILAKASVAQLADWGAAFFEAGQALDGPNPATEFLRRAAQKGSRPAVETLAKRLNPSSQATEKQEFRRLAADQGDADAQYAEGRELLDEGNDPVTASAYLSLAAKQGHGGALRDLGFLHLQQGRPREAVTCLETALTGDRTFTQPYPGESAAGDLAILYAEGRGVSRSPAKALHYFKLAARTGHGPSADFLGMKFLQSEDGPPDYEQAAAYLIRGTEKGQAVLAQLLWQGRGTSPQPRIAAERMRALLSQPESRLRPADIPEAYAAADWLMQNGQAAWSGPQSDPGADCRAARDLMIPWARQGDLRARKLVEDLERERDCPTCGGKGRVRPAVPCVTCEASGRVTCPVCGGTGGQEERVMVRDARGDYPENRWVACPSCQRGRVPCPDCAGRGEHAAEAICPGRCRGRGTYRLVDGG